MRDDRIGVYYIEYDFSSIHGSHKTKTTYKQPPWDGQVREHALALRKQLSLVKSVSEIDNHHVLISHLLMIAKETRCKGEKEARIRVWISNGDHVVFFIHIFSRIDHPIASIRSTNIDKRTANARWLINDNDRF